MNRLIVASAVLAACACAELPSLEPNTCGNGVIERDLDEQCDLSEDEELGANVRCGDPSDVVRGCHYVCSRSMSGPSCPEGWGCSDDGVCRYASGEFIELEASPIELDAFSVLSVADVDGDSRNDLLAASPSGLSVYFGRKDDPFTTAFRYPLQSLSPELALGDVDRDGKSDVVAVSPVGPILLRGQRSRTLDPVLVSQLDVRSVASERIDWFRVVPLHEDNFTPCYDPAQSKNLLAVGTGNQVIVTYPGERPLFVRPFDAANLPSRFVTAELDFGGRNFGGDEELIIALPGTRAAQVFTQSCVIDPIRGPKKEIAQSSVSLPGELVRLPHLSLKGATQDTAMAADLDADGDADLLFPVDPAGAGEHRVAMVLNDRGVFRGGEIMPELDVLDDDVGFLGSNARPPQKWPLAAGDLDGDGDADFVTPTGFFAWFREGQEGMPGARSAQLANVFELAEAVIADVDGDGWNDIVGVAAADGALVVFSSQSGSGFAYWAAPFYISTQGVPSSLRAADFDGDGISDVAFVEQGAHFGSSLSVLYGGELAVVDLGSPGNVKDIEPASVGYTDGRSDLFLVSQNDGVEPWQVGLLFGTQERAMIAPLPVGDPSGARNRAVLGNFSYNSDTELDLAVLSYNRIDVAIGDGSGQFGEYGRVETTRWSEALGAGDAFISVECLKMVAANVDRNTPTDEMITVLDAACRDQREGPSLDDRSVLAVGFDTGGGYRARKLMLPEEIRDLSRLSALDLDGNGIVELVLVYGKEGEGGIAVLWNVDFDPAREDAILFEGSAPSIFRLEGVTPSAMVEINADKDRENELAILGVPRGGGVAYVWIGSVGEDRTIRTGEPVLELEISPRESLELVVEDIDRDGLSDLLFGDGARVHLFRSRPDGEVLE